MKTGFLLHSRACVLAAIIGAPVFLAAQQQPAIPARPPVTPTQRPVAAANGQPLPAVVKPPTFPGAGSAPATPVKKTAEAVKSGGDDGEAVQHPGASVREVMEHYQQLTDKIFILDPQIENAQVVVDTPGRLPKAVALEFIEKSLLMNGFAIVPSGDKMVKVLAVGMGKSFAPEGNGEIILDPAKLPKSDQAVSFLLPLNNMKAEDAAQQFSQIMQGHAYAKITPIPNAHALVIYEN